MTSLNIFKFTKCLLFISIFLTEVMLLQAQEHCRTPAVQDGICNLFEQCPGIKDVAARLTLAELIQQYGGCGQDSVGNTRLCCPRNVQRPPPSNNGFTNSPSGSFPFDPNSSSNCGRRGGGRGQEFPFVVALGRLQDEFKVLCSGVIITESWIITDAECALGSYISHAKVGLTIDNDRYEPVSQAVPNDSYDPETKTGNVGMIKLESPLVFDDYVQPVCLSPSSSPQLKSLIAVKIVPHFDVSNPLKQTYITNTDVVNHYLEDRCILKDIRQPYTQETICTSPVGRELHTIYSVPAKYLLLRRDLQKTRLVLQGVGGPDSRKLYGDSDAYTTVTPHIPWIKSIIESM